MKTMEEKKYNHIELNNEVTKRKDNGFFNLEKDQESLKVYPVSYTHLTLPRRG